MAAPYLPLYVSPLHLVLWRDLQIVVDLITRHHVGRSDNRLRPASAGSARNLDDKTPFLSHNAQIGRNFDEDERKPLDGVSGPRRTISDVNIHAQESGFVEPKMDNFRGIRTGNMTASVQISQLSGDSVVSPHTGRRIEVHNGGLCVQNFTGSVSTRLNYSNVADNTGKTGWIQS
ncbi:uncharacterized protein LOC142555919 isoform X2 [Primulina tabacum]|uniref:uncharacterized protein LOC142555919 isoform X2 n=1 Tax=Primulina tabacum TaxID=48773 RepID=UPI003F5A715A